MKEYPKKTVKYQGRTPGTVQKGVYPSPLVSFHFPCSGTNPSPNSF